MSTLLFKRNLIKALAYDLFSLLYQNYPCTEFYRTNLVKALAFDSEEDVSSSTEYILSLKYPKALQTNLTLTKQIKKYYVLQNNIQGIPKQLYPFYEYFSLEQKRNNY